MAVPVVVELSAVIVTVSGDTPRILTVGDALPYGPLDPECDPTLGLALRRLVREQTGLELERYELLYEAGLVAEARRAGRAPPGTPNPGPGLLGEPLALDHRRIAATALGRLRGKLTYRPVVFELLPPTFTLLRLQQLVEALAGARLHKQNFRRLVERGRLVEGTGRYESRTGGRPAELFRFRQEVLWERSRAGVTLPAQRG